MSKRKVYFDCGMCRHLIPMMLGDYLCEIDGEWTEIDAPACPAFMPRANEECEACTEKLCRGLPDNNWFLTGSDE